MKNKTKLTAALLLIITLTAIISARASLTGLQLRPGLPFPGAGTSPASVDPHIPLPPSKSGLAPALLRGILALLFVTLLGYGLLSLLTLVDLKKTLRTFILLAVLFALVTLIPDAPRGPPALVAPASSSAEVRILEDFAATPLGSPPPLLSGLVVVGLLLLVALLAWRLRPGPPPVVKIEDRILRQAEDAIAALESGGPLGSVIVRCYEQMSELLREEQGIERGRSMTAREFERLLVEKGLPGGPVHRLTLLFEKARYGSHLTAAGDEQMSLECLEAIAASLREKPARPASGRDKNG